MSICHGCNREMLKTDSCLTWSARYEGGLVLSAVPYHPENGNEPCGDCGVLAGGIHHPHCDQEICPRCGGQAISCDCQRELV